jgi:hypothetical protein
MASHHQKESSAELSTLAAKVLNMKRKTGFISYEAYNDLLAEAQRLAGCVLSQDETKGQGNG